MSGRYDLGQLGWHQFTLLVESLCRLDADVAGHEWIGTRPERVARIEGPVEIGGQRLEGSVLLSIQTSFEVVPLPPLTRTGVLFTPGTVARERLEADGWVGQFDGVGLSTLLDARADLRRAVPSVLGLCPLQPLLDPAVVARASFDLGAARALAKVFVPTGAYARALDAVARHHFVVLTGPPEMGKTAIARMVGLVQLTDGWEVHECTRPEQVHAAYAADRPQVFVADDAFGSTEYRPEAAERWANELDGVLRRMDERHWLLWTSRPTPLHAGLRRLHRERGLERFPDPGEVLVDAGALTIEERAHIFYRHAKPLRRELRKLLRSRGLGIVEHPHFTPERVRRYCADAAAAKALGAIEPAFTTPTDAMRGSFDTLSGEQRDLLVAMLDQPPGPVSERALTAALRRLHPGVQRHPADLVDRLTDHFIRIV